MTQPFRPDEERVIYDLFSHELYFQIIAGLQAKTALLGNAFSTIPEGLWAGDVFRIQAEDFLLRCANVSRIFFNPDAPRRCAVLRARLSVADTSPVRKTSVRNAMQHHDEYLDKQVKEQLAGRELVLGLDYRMTTHPDGSFDISWQGRTLSTEDFKAIVAELERLKLLLEAGNSYLAAAREPL